MLRRGSQRVYQVLSQHIADPIWAERIVSNSSAGTSGLTAGLTSGTQTFSRVWLRSGRLAAASARRPVGGLIPLQQPSAGRQRVCRGMPLTSVCCGVHAAYWPIRCPLLLLDEAIHSAFNLYLVRMQLHARLGELFRRGFASESSGPQKSEFATAVYMRMHGTICVYMIIM